MKATLEYDLIEDENQFKIACTALDWYLTVYDIDNELRKLEKYGTELKTADEAVEMIRDKLCEIMDNRNLSLDMIE